MRNIYILAAIIILSSGLLLLACSSTDKPAASGVNTSPVIRDIAYPMDVSPGTEIALVCVATDADGDALTYQWSSDNGTIKASGSRAIYTSPDSKGTYNITVIVADGRGGKASSTVPVNVIGNASGLPEDPLITLNLTLPSGQPVEAKKRQRIWTTTEISCQVAAGDTDLKYDWVVTGGKLQAPGLAEKKATKVGWIAPGVKGEYTVTVTVSNSKGDKAQGRVIFDVFCCGDQ